MGTVNIKIFTQVGDFGIELNNSSNDDFIDFLKIFNHEINNDISEIIIYRIQTKNTLMVEQLNLFIKKYPRNPALHKMKSKLNQLKDGEYFIVLLDCDELTQEEILKIFFEVEELNGGSSSKVKYEQLRDQFAQVLDNYSVRTFSERKKTKLGESNKDLRRCRFCFRGKKEGATFFSEAHAISEALGNKMLIQYEECDECNSYFEKNIEKHLIKYLDIYRTFFGIKNKENKSQQ